MAKKLSIPVAEKYELIGIKPGKIVHHVFGTLDFTSMDLQEADLLFKSGCELLKLKEATAKAKKK